MNLTPADRLKQARLDAGYDTAVHAAEAFGWNINTYKSHEAGIRGIRSDVAQRYAKAFRVSAGWILTGETSLAEPSRSYRHRSTAAADRRTPNDKATHRPDLDELFGDFTQKLFDLHESEKLPITVGEAAAIAHEMFPDILAGSGTTKASVQRAVKTALDGHRSVLRRRRAEILRRP